MGESETSRREVKLAHRNGLHLTPIQQLVKAMNAYSSDVTLHFDGKSASAKSPMDLMLLGATCGAVLALEASGADSDSALEDAIQILSVESA